MTNLTIKSVKLENWRKYPCLKAELSEGLNVLTGDNEIGKSTLVEGLRFALFVRHDARFDNILKSILPQHDQNAEPTVTVEIELDSAPWSISKTWCKKSQKRKCKLQGGVPVKTWNDKDAEDHFADLLGLNRDDQSDVEKLGMTAISGQRDPGSFVESGLPSMMGKLLVAADGAVTAGPRLREIVKTMTSEVNKNFLKKAENQDQTNLSKVLGKNAEGSDSRERLANIEVELAHLDEQLLSVASLREEVSKLERQIEVKEKEAQAATKDWEEARYRFQKQRKIKAELAVLERDLDKAKTSFEKLEQERDAIRRWLDDEGKTKINLDKLKKRLPELEEQETETNTARGRSRAELESAQEAHSKQSKLVKALILTAECEEMESKIEELQAKLQAREKVEAELRGAREKLAGLGRIPTDKEISVIRKESEELQLLERDIAQTVELRMTLETAGQIRWTKDGKEQETANIEAEESHVLHAVREMELEVPGVGKMSVRCGAKGLDELLDEIRLKTEKLNKKLAPFGTNSSRVAADRFREMELKRMDGQKLEKKVNDLSESLEDESRFGVDGLETTISDLEQQLSEKKSEIEAYDPLPEFDGDIDQQCQTAEQKLTEMGAAVDNLKIHADETDKAFEKVRREIEGCKKDIQHETTSLDRVERELSELDGRAWSADEWREKLGTASLEMAELSKTIEKQQEILKQTGAEITEEALEEVRQTSQDREIEKNEIRNALTETKTKLESEAPGVSETRRDELLAEKQIYQESANSAETRLAAVWILHRATKRLISEEKSAVAAPLQRLLSPKMTGIRGISTEVLVDETEAKITGIISHEQGRAMAVSYPELSEGTREQLAMAIRMCVAEELARTIPAARIVVLDDPMTNTDDQRRRRLLTDVKNAAGDLQVLFVTCHPESVASLPGNRVALKYA